MKNGIKSIYFFLILLYIFLSIFSSINLMFYFNLKDSLDEKKRILTILEEENRILLSEVNYIQNQNNDEKSIKYMIFKKKENEKFILLKNNRINIEIINVKKNRFIYSTCYILINLIILFILIYNNFGVLIKSSNYYSTKNSLEKLNRKYYKGL